MALAIEVTIPRFDGNLSIDTPLNISIINNTELDFNLYIAKDGIPIEIPETQYVWLLSDSEPQPLGIRGIWVDTESWDDDAILYV